ncbi:MAG: hypothetical protein E7599_01290 [Ruminococcaceae bacterium]|nr:hypothetical protein [Oscillospiraceae bacterium]
MKRVILFAGHYGSGKTNIAVNYALHMAKAGLPTAFLDIDIVNPYYRAKDSEELLAQNGIEFISSEYANSNVDVPALPDEIYAVLDRPEQYYVLDVGGDDRGALALGRLSPGIAEENNFEMLFVYNASRPLTSDTEGALEVADEILAACHLPFTGIVNNTNIGKETTAETVIAGYEKAKAVADAMGLPIVMNTVRADLVPALEEKIPDLFPLTLQNKRLYGAQS